MLMLVFQKCSSILDASTIYPQKFCLSVKICSVEFCSQAICFHSWIWHVMHISSHFCSFSCWSLPPQHSNYCSHPSCTPKQALQFRCSPVGRPQKPTQILGAEAFCNHKTKSSHTARLKASSASCTYFQMPERLEREYLHSRL